MPEWSNGPHSKCGERVTVPGVRIPLFPLQEKQEIGHPVSCFFYFYLLGTKKTLLFSWIIAGKNRTLNTESAQNLQLQERLLLRTTQKLKTMKSP